MAHSYVSCLVHYVFSTKERQPWLSSDARPRLFAYIGGIARENDLKAYAVGGAADHVHALLSLPSTVSAAKGVQLIKGGSSLWVHQTFADMRAFEWQEGYGAFSAATSQVDDTIAYIQSQEEHHRRRTFQEEFLLFLRRHGIDYDPRYVWG
jgi:putative transposase